VGETKRKQRELESIETDFPWKSKQGDGGGRITSLDRKNGLAGWAESVIKHRCVGVRQKQRRR